MRFGLKVACATLQVGPVLGEEGIGWIHEHWLGACFHLKELALLPRLLWNKKMCRTIDTVAPKCPHCTREPVVHVGTPSDLPAMKQEDRWLEHRWHKAQVRLHRHAHHLAVLAAKKTCFSSATIASLSCCLAKLF